jgi:molybdopterin converting factor small subunit
MRIHVRLFSRFQEHLPPEAHGVADVDLPDGATVGDLVGQLGIVRRVKLITVNDRPETDLTRPLAEGDSVRIFPIVVGG